MHVLVRLLIPNGREQFVTHVVFSNTKPSLHDVDIFN